MQPLAAKLPGPLPSALVCHLARSLPVGFTRNLHSWFTCPFCMPEKTLSVELIALGVCIARSQWNATTPPCSSSALWLTQHKVGWKTIWEVDGPFWSAALWCVVKEWMLLETCKHMVILMQQALVKLCPHLKQILLLRISQQFWRNSKKPSKAASSAAVWGGVHPTAWGIETRGSSKHLYFFSVQKGKLLQTHPHYGKTS